METSASALFLSGFIGAGAATSIRTLPKTGGNSAPLLQTSPSVSASMAVENGVLYWVLDDSIRKVTFTDGAVPVPTGPSSPLHEGALGIFDRFRPETVGFGFGSDLQIAGGRLVFINRSTVEGYSLKSVATAGTGVLTLVDSLVEGAFAVSGSDVFYYQRTSANSGYVGQVSAAGGTPIHLANEFGPPNAIASDGQNVWYARGNVVARVRTGLDLQLAETVYTGGLDAIVTSLLVDGAAVYLIEDVGPAPTLGFASSCTRVRIMKKVKTDSSMMSPSIVATISDGTEACAVGQATQDSGAIYFALGRAGVSGNSVMKLAK